MESTNTSDVDRAQSAHLSSDVGASTSLPMLKKRKIRHSRVKTGCRSCRGRRVKCKEGLLLAPGVKLPCDQCHEVGNECYYPDPEDTGRTTTRWIISAQVDENGRIIPWDRGGPKKILVKREKKADEGYVGPGDIAIQQGDFQSQSRSIAGSTASISVKREPIDNELARLPASVEGDYPAQSQPPHRVEARMQQLPLDQYYMNTPLQEYFSSGPLPLIAPAPPTQPVFAESALRGQPSERSFPESAMKGYQSIPGPNADSGITLGRIPKGIGTSDHRHARHDSTAPPAAHLWTFAQPSYPEPIAPAIRTPWASFSSADTSTVARLSAGIQSRSSMPGDFQLHLSRMPWVKRTSTHVDYTRSRSIRKAAERQDDRCVADALYQYLNKVNPPVRPLRTFSLASLADSPLERAAMTYFETRGCAEIIAVDEMESNWIHAQLFPRVYETLSDGDFGLHRQRPPSRSSQSARFLVDNVPARNNVGRASGDRVTRDFLHHSLIRLSCVHRVNTERDPGRIQELRREIMRHGKLAMMAGLQIRVRFPTNYSKREEYLMAVFIGYMADMLDSQEIRIDPKILVPDQDRVPSAFEKILREMLAVYLILKTSFRPHDPLYMDEHSEHGLFSPHGVSSTIAMPEPEASHVDWLEAFFGLTRPTIVKIQIVNSLVSRRAELLRTSQDNGEAGQKLRQEAAVLAKELGVDDGSSETALSMRRIDGAIGKPGRVSRGTNVMRHALLMIVLCELLEVDLDDSRLAQARDSTLEMVADSEISETAGLSWALTIAAIYANAPARPALTSLLRTTQETSFGANYVHATLEILSICWKVISIEGSYRNGIAPWREAMAVVGRSMYL